MATVVVASDTTHYLPRELVEANGIVEVPLYVNWDGRTDKESSLSDLKVYYDHLRVAPDLPTTSQPSVGDFVAAYEKLLAAGRDVVSIHISGAISGTCEAARQAKQQLEEEGRGGERITVVDSRTCAGGLACVLLAATKAAREGADSEAVATRAHEARAALKIWFVVDTMEFLRRGGRVGAARAWIGSTLKIKPILTLEEQVTPVERVRTAGRAFERMCEYMEQRRDESADGWVVQHIQARGEAERLAERGREIFGVDPLFVSEVGPVIGTHVGPGLLGVGGVPGSLVR